MKMTNAIVLAVAVVLVLCPGLSPGALFRGDVGPPDWEDAAALLPAPQIVIATVNVVSTKGKGTVKRGGEMEVELLDMTIKVQRVIKGTPLAGSVIVEGLVRPTNQDTYLGRQVPEPGHSYVLFLQQKEGKKVFEPFVSTEFGLRVERVPDEVAGVSSAIGALKLLAKANAQAREEIVAFRWLIFLGDVFVAGEDLEFCLKLTGDERLAVRGSAIAVLVEHVPTHDGLYESAMAFLSEASAKKGQLGLGRARRKISKRLLATVPETEVNGALKEWLASDIRDLQQAALTSVRKTADASLIDDVVALMQRTADRDIQYACIVALSAARSVPGPGYRTFHKDPDKYVREWAKMSDK